MADAVRYQAMASDAVAGLPVDRDGIFTNHKGVYKKSVEKRQTKLLHKLAFLKPFLEDGERILLVTTGCSPMSYLEQFLGGTGIFYLKRALFVFTTKRIFHVPTRMDYSYRHSIARIAYADCESIALKGRTLAVAYKNQTKEKFYHLAGREKKKIRELLKTVSCGGAQSTVPARTHLCPRCTRELTPEEYTCPSCRLEFKDAAEGRRVSIAYPGGGYFYTGHPLLGAGDALVESFLIIALILTLAEIVRGAQGQIEPFITIAVVLALEKAVSVYHAHHFIKEFIPKEKDVQPMLAN